MNIISIRGNIDSLYKPSFGYYINVPEYKHTILFYNDCHYYFNCAGYCIFNTLDYDEYASCSYGCNMFENTKMCNCNSIIDNDYNIDYFNSKEKFDFNIIDYNNESCRQGCSLAMSKYLYPNYTLYENSIGYEKYELNTNYSYNNNISCLDNMLLSCNNNDDCSSFSLTNHNNKNTMENKNYMNYYKPYYKKDNTTNIIIKNSFLDILDITSTTFVFRTSGQFSLKEIPKIRTLAPFILISCFTNNFSISAETCSPIESFRRLPAKIISG